MMYQGFEYMVEITERDGGKTGRIYRSDREVVERQVLEDLERVVVTKVVEKARVGRPGKLHAKRATGPTRS